MPTLRKKRNRGHQCWVHLQSEPFSLFLSQMKQIDITWCGTVSQRTSVPRPIELFLLTNALFPFKRAKGISTAAVTHKSTDIKTKPDEVLTCCICIQGQTNLRYILYKAAVLVHSQIIKLENKTFKKYCCPKPRKRPISISDAQRRFASLNFSPKLCTRPAGPQKSTQV